MLRGLETLLFTAEVDKYKFADVFNFYCGDLNAESSVTQCHVLHSNLPAEVQNEKGEVKLKAIVKILAVP